jgi:heme/copper-type cytochrome/quinol oxidase subunit 4
MNDIRGWAIYAWIALPTVMYGGYALLGLLTKEDALTPFRRTWFRAGHAHAGIMLIMALVFFDYLTRTSMSFAIKQIACGAFVVGVLAQSGGFFVHMSKGDEGKTSMGTTLTSLGAVILTIAIGILVYGLAFRVI